MSKLTTRTTMLATGILVLLVAGLLFHHHLMYRLVTGEYIDPFSRHQLEKTIAQGDCNNMLVLLRDASFRDDTQDIVKYLHAGSPFCGRASLLLSKIYFYKASTCSDNSSKIKLIMFSKKYAKLAIKNAGADDFNDPEEYKSTISESEEIIAGSYSDIKNDNIPISDFSGCDPLSFDENIFYVSKELRH